MLREDFDHIGAENLHRLERAWELSKLPVHHIIA